MELQSLDLEAMGSMVRLIPIYYRYPTPLHLLFDLLMSMVFPGLVAYQVTDTDIMKEAKPSFYLKYILPILHLNRVVHFVGFGNRLASDPIPHKLQVNSSRRFDKQCEFMSIFALSSPKTSLLNVHMQISPLCFLIKELHLETSMQMQLSCAKICP